MPNINSPIVANLYMKFFEHNALSTATQPLRMWLRCVDDTFVIQKEDQKQNFLEDINSVDLTTRFTVEDKEDGATPLLDTIGKQEADGRLSITLYRKPTHIYQYVQ